MSVDLEKSRHSSVTDDTSVAPQHQPKQEDSSGFTPEQWALDKAAVRRLDWTLLPLCAMIYLLNFLDRSNLSVLFSAFSTSLLLADPPLAALPTGFRNAYSGNAKIAGLAVDLHLSSHQYLIAVTCSYVLYIAFEFPSNLLLKRVGANIMIPAMITSWGLVCCFTGFVQSYHGLVAARLMLGLAEGGLFPGLVLYLSCFYRRRELQTRISLFFAAASLSGAFSGLLAAAIINLDGKGGQEGWRWIFFIEGGFTVLFGLAISPFLPARPSKSRFLTPEQAAHIEYRLTLDSPAGSSGFDDAFSWKEVWNAVRSPHVILLFIALFCNGTTLYGFSYFTPTVISTFGYTTVQTQLLTVPPYVCAFLLTLFNAWWSDRYGRRGLCAIFTSLLALVGYIMFYKSTVTGVRYPALFLAITGVYSTSPALVTWLPNNSAGHYRKATAVALGFISTNSGGIASTWLFPQEQSPHYSTAGKTMIALTVMIIVFCGINLLYLRRENRLKAEQRAEDERLGKGIVASEWHEKGDWHQNYVYTY
ncbi:hypothetical protein JCM11641_005946 [Rhodosporidiobolus odoratus]